jgi:hypothetical protein
MLKKPLSVSKRRIPIFIVLPLGAMLENSDLTASFLKMSVNVSKNILHNTYCLPQCCETVNLMG